MTTHWFDRMTAAFAPHWTLKRQRARIAAELLGRHYDAASVGRRTQGWRKSSGDANAVIGAANKPIREAARDLVRNNPYAESALGTIADHAVGGGILAKPRQADPRVEAAWHDWAETTACDADGRHDLYGLQKLIMRTVVESGEVLVRRRLRRPTDGVFLNTQIQVIDPDFLDTAKDQDLAGGARIIQGVEFDPIGRRTAYWLFPEHPGSLRGGFPSSQRVPAESVLHVFRPMRPGQVRGISWFAPVLLRARDFDEFEDATLIKQKIAACLAVLTSDPDGTAPALGVADTTQTPEWDSIQPGAVMNLQPGRDVHVVNPPATNDYDAYAKTQLRAIATGLGVTYEDLTGDYTDMPFSAARMSRIRHWARVEDWRWRILIPQFCDPVWTWVMEAAAVQGVIGTPQGARWTCEPAPMIDPVNEGLAYQRLVRNGLKSLSESLREQGYDPEAVLEEMARDNATLDRLKLILDSDPRQMTQAGQLQGSAAAAPAATGSADGEGTLRTILAQVGEERALEAAITVFGEERFRQLATSRWSPPRLRVTSGR